MAKQRCCKCGIETIRNIPAWAASLQLFAHLSGKGSVGPNLAQFSVPGTAGADEAAAAAPSRGVARRRRDDYHAFHGASLCRNNDVRMIKQANSKKRTTTSRARKKAPRSMQKTPAGHASGPR